MKNKYSRKREKIMTSVILLMIISAFSAFPVSIAASETPNIKIDAGKDPEVTIAPDFELKDTGGETVSLSDFRGKVVMVVFWTTW